MVNSARRSTFRQRSADVNGFRSGRSTFRQWSSDRFQALGESGESIGAQMFSNISDQLNGYADKTGTVFSEVLPRKNLVERSQLIRHSGSAQQPPRSPTTTTTQTQRRDSSAANHSKNQQSVKEICDGVLAGQGVSMFSIPKLRKLMEEESLRTLACAKLNLGLERKHVSEDEFLEDIAVSRSVWKGIVRVLQSCVQGLECSYMSGTGGGIASAFQLLEIAHTHYWSSEASTPGSSGQQSLQSTPSVSLTDLSRIGRDAMGSFQRAVDGRGLRASGGIQLSVTSDNYKPDVPTITEPPAAERNSHGNSPFLKSASGSDSEGTVASLGSTPSALSEPARDVMPTSPIRKPDPPGSGEKHFVYQELFSAHSSHLWGRPQFWEDLFHDATALERELVGLDQEIKEMMERYMSLSDPDRKRLELDEDRILSTLLHNLAAFMVLTGVSKQQCMQKVRRLLGKAHVGLVHSQKINILLDKLPPTGCNSILLRPHGSRLMQKQSFTVHFGADQSGDLVFLEVCDEAIVLRGVNGSIMERWWYDQLVNMTYSPKTRVLCLWRRSAEQVLLHKFYTKKCRDLYNCLKNAMEKAASKGKGAAPDKQLGGEFPVQDMETNQGGLLQVRIDGIALVFAEKKWFVPLSNIKKCNTHKGNIFVLEEYDRKHSRLVQRRYVSQMADQICYAVLCVFSYVAAQHQARS